MARYGKTGDDLVNEVCAYLKQYFAPLDGIRPVIGLSGGKDSSVLAAALVHAGLNPFGVLMPNGVQHDIDYSEELAEHLGLDYTIINIKPMTDAFKLAVGDPDVVDEELSEQCLTNMPARVRMTTLYMVAQHMDGRVMNTCNMSEDIVGYATKYGDGAGDVSPLSNLTVSEVRELGRALGLPSKFIEKVPEDGLSGKTDEENLGITYDQIDKYIETGTCGDESIDDVILSKQVANYHKLRFMPCFQLSRIQVPNDILEAYVVYNDEEYPDVKYIQQFIDYKGINDLYSDEVHELYDTVTAVTIRVYMNDDGSVYTIDDDRS